MDRDKIIKEFLDKQRMRVGREENERNYHNLYKTLQAIEDLASDLDVKVDLYDLFELIEELFYELEED